MPHICVGWEGESSMLDIMTSSADTSLLVLLPPPPPPCAPCARNSTQNTKASTELMPRTRCWIRSVATFSFVICQKCFRNIRVFFGSLVFVFSFY